MTITKRLERLEAVPASEKREPVDLSDWTVAELEEALGLLKKGDRVSLARGAQFQCGVLERRAGGAS